MNYKKFLKSREMRLRLLRLLSFVPDKAMLKLQYRIKTGRPLNLKAPERFTEKLQWLKLNYRNPLMVPCVDKYDVRSHVQSKGLEHILTQCLGIFDRAEDIDFDVLPEQFVVKDTLGGGGNSVIVVRRKSETDLEALRGELAKWLQQPHNIRDGGREWPYYSGQKRRIIIEEFLAQPEGDLTDYKFFCFNGECELFFIRTVVENDHDAGEMAYYDGHKNYLPNVGVDYYKAAKVEMQLPAEIDEMLRIARELSKDFPHVRVDLYNVDGRIVFGELTFFHMSGYFHFIPDSVDFELGKKLDIPCATK